MGFEREREIGVGNRIEVEMKILLVSSVFRPAVVVSGEEDGMRVMRESTKREEEGRRRDEEVRGG